MMMKNGKSVAGSKRIWGVLLALVIICVAVGIYAIWTASVQDRTKIKLPTVQLKTVPAFGNTFTPNPTDIANNRINGEKTIYPTPAQYSSVSKTIDVSPEMDDIDKLLVIVAHPNGMVVEYTVGPLPFGDRDHPYLSDDLLKKLNLQAGDQILLVDSVASFEAHLQPTASATSPIAPTVPPAPTSLPVTYPYPAP